MYLVGENFSRNGSNSFRGTVKALEDDGTFTSWSDVVNIYNRKERLKLVENLANDLSLTLDRARSMVSELFKRLEAEVRGAEALPDEADERKTQGTLLVQLAEGCEFWHTPDDKPFATIEVDKHRENWPINARAFRQWLSFQFY